jgi:hypothetical protein
MELASFLREEDRWVDHPAGWEVDEDQIEPPDSIDLRGLIFTMPVWFALYPCGAACCIGGTASLLQRRTNGSAQTSNAYRSQDSRLKMYYGLCPVEWEALCYPCPWPSSPGDHSFQTTRTQAAALIEAIANGAELVQGRWKLPEQEGGHACGS